MSKIGILPRLALLLTFLVSVNFLWLGGETYAQEASPVAAARTQYPLTIENCGQTLTFTQAPERVITTFQNLTELMVALGLGDRIVGTQYSTYAEPPAEIADAYANVPVLSDEYATTEAIIQARPDLYLASFYYDFGPDGGLPTREEIERAGAQVFISSNQCSAEGSANGTVDMGFADTLLLGQIFDVQDRAQALVNAEHERIAAVQAQLTGAPPVKALFFVSGEGPLYLLGGGIYSDLLRLAGAENVFEAQIAENPEVSIEEVLRRSPEIEAFVIDDFEGRGAAQEKADFLSATFPQSPAAQSARIAVIQNEYLSSGIRVADAVEILARGLHPELFDAPAASPVASPVAATGPDLIAEELASWQTNAIPLSAMLVPSVWWSTMAPRSWGRPALGGPEQSR